jgi:hypothetical protein
MNYSSTRSKGSVITAKENSSYTQEKTKMFTFNNKNQTFFTHYLLYAVPAPALALTLITVTTTPR